MRYSLPRAWSAHVITVGGLKRWAKGTTISPVEPLESENLQTAWNLTMVYSPEFKARVDRLVGTGYLKVLEDMVKSMCAPFWWSSRTREQAARVVGSGTICFVNTGTKHIGVTADHVFADYLKSKEMFPDVECQFGGNRFSPEDYLIDRSSENELDLATFTVPEVFVSASDRYHH